MDEKVIDIKQLVLRDILRSGKMDESAWQVVEELVSHPSWDVREEVAHLLSRIGHLRPRRALRILRRMVGDDPWVLETVASAVGEVGGEPISSLNILRVLSKDGSFWVRKNVISSALRILSLDPDIAIEEMKRWAYNPNRYTRQSAAIILGKMRTEPSSRIKILKELCLDRYNDVRRAALLSLIHLCDGGMIDILTTLSKDPHWRIREIVAWAIGRKPEEGSCRILEGLIYDGVGAVRRAAASVLVALVLSGKEEYLHMTKKIVKEDAGIHPDVLCIIARSLRPSPKLSKNLSLELLHRLSEDEDASVRRAALDSILEFQRMILKE